MNNTKRMRSYQSRRRSLGGNAACSPARFMPQAGFTLVELMLAMAIFVVVFAIAMLLFVQQQQVFSQQKGQVALNIGLRSAITQLQMDLANAGSGYFVGADIPSWPVGVTIMNNVPGPGCYNASTKVYSSLCFDTLNVLAVDSTTPPIHSNDSSNGGCTQSSTSSSNGDPAAGKTAAATAAYFKSGDQLLFLKGDGSQMTTVVLTAPATVAPDGSVCLPHNATGSDGSNNQNDDPMGITTRPSGRLGPLFCTTDWILKLSPITYAVDSSDPNNPKLTRSQKGSTVTVMDQLIGFKVGATIWNASTNSVATQYNYDASTYTNTTPNDQAYNYSLVRSVRVSLIGRTAPSRDPTYKFRNTFDGGAYQIQGATVVVNPRNLSMHD